MAASRLQSEGCEFDPRGGLVHHLFAVSASLATSPEFAEDGIRRHQAKDNEDSYIHSLSRSSPSRRGGRLSSGWSSRKGSRA